MPVPTLARVCEMALAQMLAGRRSRPRGGRKQGQRPVERLGAVRKDDLDTLPAVGRELPQGKTIAIRDPDGLTRALCETFVRQRRPLSGTEFRYVRTSGLQLSQPALGGALGTDAQTVARWEKQGRIPKMGDKMNRLIYLEHIADNERLSSAFETLRAMERAKNGPHPTRVIAEAKGEHWESRLEGDDEVDAVEQPS